MNTLAVMCMALQSTSPSWIPLLRTISSTWRVMLMKSIRAGTLKVRYSVCDFMKRHVIGPDRCSCGGRPDHSLHRFNRDSRT